MTAFYRLLFRVLQWHAMHVERLLYWAYVRSVDYDETWISVEVVEAEPPHENVVHLPRRGMH